MGQAPFVARDLFWKFSGIDPDPGDPRPIHTRFISRPVSEAQGDETAVTNRDAVCLYSDNLRRLSMPVTFLTRSLALRGCNFFQEPNSPSTNQTFEDVRSQAGSWQRALIASILICCSGCGKPEPQAPVPPQPGPTASVETGTVKIELDVPLDPTAVITIGGSDYSPKDLEQELKLPEGEHSISVKQPGLTLGPQPFRVAKNQRRIVHVYEPNRRAAEWAIGLGGRVNLIADGRELQFTSLEKLPASSFTIVAISLEEKSLGDDDLTNLRDLTRLKTLSLARTGITGAGLVHLRGLPELAELNVDRTQVTDESLKELSSLPNLTTLHAFATTIGDEGAAQLRGSKLTILGLGRSRLTDHGLESLAQISSLTSLNVSQTAVTDRGLTHIARLPNLRILNLDNTQVTDTGLSELKSHPKLVALFVAGTRLTDQGLEQLCQSNRWTSLRLNNTQVTDAGLQHVAGLDKLIILGVYKTQITDAGLQSLKTLKSLQSLQVADSKVTNAGIADLKTALPKLNIER
jgi:Leucine-rich repeat (LRR) protein